MAQLFHGMGLHIDASSGFEVHRAMAAGIPAKNMSLSSQALKTPPYAFARDCSLVGLSCCLRSDPLRTLQHVASTRRRSSAAFLEVKLQC